jgi:hypothetical protein
MGTVSTPPANTALIGVIGVGGPVGAIIFVQRNIGLAVVLSRNFTAGVPALRGVVKTLEVIALHTV